MRFHRLRIQVDDLPGRLAAVAANLAACGVNIVDIDVHSAGSRARVDELIVEFTVPLDLPAVEYAVTSARAAFLDIEAIDPHALCDRATSALDAAASAIGADPASAGVTAAAQALVEAEVAWDAPGDGLGADHPVVRQALDGRSPVHASEPVQRLPNGDRPTWWLALPYESPAGLRVLVLVRRTARFTFTETSRLQALLRVATAARGVVAGSTVDLADGGAVTVRALDPSDAGAVSRLHARCSRETLRRRYLSAPATQIDHIVRPLLDVDGRTRLGVVAALGTELVGLAHACADRDGMELAFMVEDAHQRRGIGTALLGELARSLLAIGVDAAYVLTTADNEPMRRLVAPVVRSSRMEDDLLHLSVPLDSVPGAHRRAPLPRHHQRYRPAGGLPQATGSC